LFNSNIYNQTLADV